MKRRRWLAGFALLFLAAAFTPLALAAQNAPVNVYGNVLDRDGKAVAGVTITFISADNGKSAGADVVTDAQGYYSRTIGIPGNKNGYFATPKPVGKTGLEPKRAKITKSGRCDFVLQQGKGAK